MIVKCSNCVLKWKKTGLRACAVNFLGPILVSRAPFRESLSSDGHSNEELTLKLNLVLS